jgi:hypothetical protein
VAAPSPDPTEPLDSEIQRFEAFADGLVRLEPHPFAELRAEVERFALAIEHHLGGIGDGRSPKAGHRFRPGGARQRLAAEHERFRASLAELRGLLAIVKGDDHGGHRQALGQYGRLVTEALRLHRAEERVLARRETARTPPGNHN